MEHIDVETQTSCLGAANDKVHLGAPLICTRNELSGNCAVVNQRNSDSITRSVFVYVHLNPSCVPGVQGRFV